MSERVCVFASESAWKMVFTGMRFAVFSFDFQKIAWVELFVLFLDQWEAKRGLERGRHTA
jgi:hypothetical protein